jgi:cytochrome b subunit of formate dehydrogenase
MAAAHGGGDAMSVTLDEPAIATEASQPAVRRFSAWARATHAVLAFAVFGLILTGMPLRYPDTFWARGLFRLFQEQGGAVAVHKVCAVLFFTAGGMHLAALFVGVVTRRLTLRSLFGPDSIVPSIQDVRNIRGHIDYLQGRGPRPDYGRFAFWEKFDYLAEIWGLLVIGLSGLIMWFPVRASFYLPGWVVNAALIFHGYEAILAMAFLFTVHFFNTHLRPEIFPVDPVIFTGEIPLHEVRERYPGWYRRLIAADAPLEENPRTTRFAYVLTAFYLSVGLGIMLLVMLTALVEVIRAISAILSG